VRSITFSVDATHTTYKFSNSSYSDISDGLAHIRFATSARPDGYRFMPAYKRGAWDGYIKLCKDNIFPSGLVHRVSQIMRQAGFGVTIQDNRDIPDYNSDVIRPDVFDGITLRDYQIDAAKRMLSHSCGIAKMATNAGKTAIIALLCRALPGNVLVLTTKKDLLYQTSDRLSVRLNEPVGVVGDGKRIVRRVTVGMVQTLVKHPFNEKLTCVVFDECHHIPSKTSQQVLFNLDAPYRFGMSGTPLRHAALNDLVLIASTGEVIVEVTNADLIKSGISARPIIHMYGVFAVFKDQTWQEAYQTYIVDNTKRNNIIADVLTEYDYQSALVLVERLAHGRALEDLVPGSMFVNGSDDVDERMDVLDDLRAGNGAIVIATPIFDEGVDVPSVDLLVLAGGGKGHIRLLQRLGRGMRQKGGDNVLRVVDFVDDTSRHLLLHSLKRCELYEQEGFEVVLGETV